MLDIFGLALVAALWPALVAVALIALASPRPMSILVWFLAGGLLTTTAIGIAVAFSLEGSSFFTGSRPATPPAIDLAVGLVLLVLAGVGSKWNRPTTEPATPPEREPWTERMLARESGFVSFLVGVVLNLVPGLFAVVGYTHIAALDESRGATVALVVGFNVIMFALIELPIAGYLVAPAWTAEHVRLLNDWLRGHGRQAIVVLAAAVGIYLVARGLVGLL